MRPRSLAWLSCCLGCARAASTGGPPPVPAAPAVAETAPRWKLFDRSGFDARAHVELENGALLAGGAGERWWRRPDGGWVAGDTMLPETITGIFRRGSEFIFVGASGATMRARTALGPLEERRVASCRFRIAAGGAKAIVAVADDGAVFRSVDLGATWARLDVEVGPRVLDELVMNGRGEGWLIAHPELVLQTADDGATWRRVTAPATVAARRCWIDDGGRLRRGGSGDAESELRARAWTKWDPIVREHETLARPSDVAWRRLRTGRFALTRDGLFGLAERAPGRCVSARVSRSADPELHDELRFGSCGRAGVGAFEDEVVVVNRDALFVSHDGGTSFEAGSLRFDDGLTSYLPPDIVVGRNGALAIEGTSDVVQVRTSASEPFRSIRGRLGASARHLGVATFAALRTEVLGNAAQPAILDVERLVTHPIAQPDFVALALATDEAGALYAYGRGSVLRSADGGERFAPSGQLGAVTSIAASGRRAMAVGPAGTRETADAGKTWSPLPNPAGEVLACDERGCLFERGLRVGWGPEAVARAESPPIEPAAPTTPRLTCRAGGAWASLGRRAPVTSDAIRPASDVRLVELEETTAGALVARVTRDPGTSATLGDTIPLLPARATRRAGEVSRTWLASTLPGGAVAIRVSRAEGAPTDSELATWHAASGVRTHAAHAPAETELDLEASWVGAAGWMIVQGRWNDGARAWWSSDGDGVIVKHPLPTSPGPNAEHFSRMVPVRQGSATWLAGDGTTISRQGSVTMIGRPDGPELHLHPLEGVTETRRIALGAAFDSALADVRILNGPSPVVLFDEPPADGASTWLMSLPGAADEVLLRVPRLAFPLPGTLKACVDAARGHRVTIESDEPAMDLSLEGRLTPFDRASAVVMVLPSGDRCALGWVAELGPAKARIQMVLDARDLAHAGLRKFAATSNATVETEARAVDCGP
jgi:hypothetical protein